MSMIRKYHNHKLQTTPWHREEEPLNHHETPGRQIKQSNQLSLPHQDNCNTKMDIKQRTTKHRTITDSHNGSNNKQKVNNNRTTALILYAVVFQFKGLFLCFSLMRRGERVQNNNKSGLSSAISLAKY